MYKHRVEYGEEWELVPSHLFYLSGCDLRCAFCVAGINAFVFHEIAYRSVGKWENDPVAPFGARAAGLISILLWFGIVAAGRWIAYV